MARFNGVELTPEAIEEARAWFIQNARECVADAESGRQRVNDLESYRAWRLQHIADLEAGRGLYSVAFLQRAYFLQTGESVPLLRS